MDRTRDNLRRDLITFREGAGEASLPEGSDTPIIGIDLGTSTSAIAVLVDGRPELLQDEQGDRIVPSVVQLNQNLEFLVGTAAKHSAITYHDRTCQEVKRLMGTKEIVKLGSRSYRPEDISSQILAHLKRAAEAKFGPRSVGDVVLSVPARFENEAREATKRAAEIVGLNVVRLINEPTAAALSYGLDRLDEHQKILVFDFGGGTLDVTILEMFEGVLDVKTSVGDDKLGGKDVDEILIKLFREKYTEQHEGAKLPPPSRDRKLAQLLKEEAENYKKQLSFSPSVPVEIPYMTHEGGISFELTRDVLDDLMEELLMRAMALVNEALSRARLRWEEIDVILPVGGSSRLGLFRRALEAQWGKPVREYDNPDEAVAKGAAIAAGIERRIYENSQRDIMILDVSPHRLGVAAIKQVGSGQYIEDYFSEIIPKDTKLPATQMREYGALFAGQETPISIRIYEATTDSNLCDDHHLLAELPLRRLSAAGAIPSAARPKDILDGGDLLGAAPVRGLEENELVQVEFRYTLDGTLDVTVRYVSAPIVRVQGTINVTNTGTNGAAAETHPPDNIGIEPVRIGANGAVLNGNGANGNGTNGNGNGSAGAAVAAAAVESATDAPAAVAAAAPPAAGSLIEQAMARWKDAPNADMCAPLLDQADRLMREHPEAAGAIQSAGDAVKFALVAGDEREVRLKLDALTDLLFEMA